MNRFTYALSILPALALACATGDTGQNPDASPAADAPMVAIDAPTQPGPDAAQAIDAALAIDAVQAIDAALPEPDAACNYAWVDLLQNGSFDSGSVDWSETTNGGDIIRQTNSPWPPNDGDHWALFLGFDDGVQNLRQTVSIPASATDLRLQGFRCWVTLESTTTPYDFLNIELRDSGDALLETLWARDNSHAGDVCGWSMFQLDATDAYAGQDVALVFDATSDGASVTSFGFDSLLLQAYACQ